MGIAEPRLSGDAARLTELIRKLRALNLEFRRAIKHYETKRGSKVTDHLLLASSLLSEALEELSKRGS
jgi:hypothetical protein